jgi:N-methylhydantoinase A
MQLAGTPSGIVPNHPGQFSAFGFTMTDARIDLERTAPMTSRFFNFEYANRVLNDLVIECSEALVEQGYTEKIEVLKTLEMRYFGQNHELEISFCDGVFTENKISSVWDSFHQAHKTRYNFDIPNETVELISIKVTALALTPKPQMPTRGSYGELPSPYEERMVFFDSGKAPAAVYRREELPIGKKFKGPALIEEDASVTVVSPNMPVLIDEYGNIVLGKLAAEYNN